MNKSNICPKCAFAIPQSDNTLGLVDCPKKGYGNAYARTCDCFLENNRLLNLIEIAIEAIKEFESLYAVSFKDSSEHAAAIGKAATHSCTMQQAYAIMLGITYDMAAEILHEEAKERLIAE